ncbi:MAG: hypothetical protein K8L97_01780 [Anaerolineae bacterium]|nr:hypothetical protein [Anaerolineae bacterium]
MNTLPAFDHIPTVTEVDQIAALSDPVIRNLQITQCYHELAGVMTARTGISANWCTFATWASKQAGQTIRKEDLARMFENIAFSAQAEQDITASAQALGSKHSQAAIQQSVAETLNPLAAFDRASEAVGRGNKKVYEEIGREFARFYAMCLNDSAFSAESITRFCETLRPGEPPDGQQYLRQAFSRYYQSFFESDAKTRAELILLANIEIGYHEQTRLQPEIAEAMNAAFVNRRQIRSRLLQRLFPYNGWLVWTRLFFMRLFGQRSRFDEMLDALVTEMRRRARLLITEYMMTIELPPDLRLRLGEDVVGEFPGSLQQLVLPDLCALMEKIDPTPNSTGKTGAVDWSALHDRLHFIVDMFRCYHESSDLFEPPFTAAQVMALKAGRRPDGRL